MDMETRIRSILEDEDVSLYGVADLRHCRAALDAAGGEIVQGYAWGISIGLALPDTIVDFLDRRQDERVALLYHYSSYLSINQRLDSIAIRLAMTLNRLGFRTLPIPASERSDVDNAVAPVSHKMIARLAGLGWIGKSCLLVTPRFGPRVRFVSLLSDAPLRPTGEVLADGCGACRECARICPAQAIRGVPFHPGESREERFDFRLCQDHFAALRLNEKRKPVCGLCLYVCPHGRKTRPPR